MEKRDNTLNEANGKREPETTSRTSKATESTPTKKSVAGKPQGVSNKPKKAVTSAAAKRAPKRAPAAKASPENKSSDDKKVAIKSTAARRRESELAKCTDGSPRKDVVTQTKSDAAPRDEINARRAKADVGMPGEKTTITTSKPAPTATEQHKDASLKVATAPPSATEAVKPTTNEAPSAAQNAPQHNALAMLETKTNDESHRNDITATKERSTSEDVPTQKQLAPIPPQSSSTEQPPHQRPQQQLHTSAGQPPQHYQNGGSNRPQYVNGNGQHRKPRGHHDYRNQDRQFDSRQRNGRGSKNGHPQSGRHQQHQKGGYDKSKEKRTQETYQFLKGPDRPALEELNLSELNIYARLLGIVGAGLMRRDKLIERIKYLEANPDMEIEVEGVLERLPDGFGFLRSAQYDYISGPDDIYVSPSQIRRLGLRTGDTVTGTIRKPKEGEKYFALLQVSKVNFADTPGAVDRYSFDALTPKHPDEKLNLEFDEKALSTRMMDIFTPIGKGQRGLIVAPPKVGKTLLLKEIAQSVIANHSDIYLIVLLVDERPEEVADMKKTVKGANAEVISSTFDESAERHVQVAEAVLAKAKRLVESGKDVMILLDSITRLARAYNTNAPASGKVLTGGIDANALTSPKRFFGAARSTEEAGSLTIIATALVDTGSRMDEVIYEEFKGTGNLEMHMTRKLSNRRIYPAFDLLVSGTRREELLHTEEDLNKVWVLQKFLATMNTVEGMEFLIDKMKKARTNRDFLNSINK